MLEDLQAVCEAEGCDRTLEESAHRLTMRTPGGVRRAYECDCGAVTIAVARR